MLDFSLLEKEVTNKQKRTTRINIMEVNQSWRHQCELMFSLLLDTYGRYRNNHRHVYILKLVYIDILLSSVC